MAKPPSRPRDPSAHPELVLQVGHAKLINALEFSPDGKWLVSASEDLTIKIWDLATGSVVRTIQTGQHTTTLAISPDATVLAAGSGSGKVLPYSDDQGKYTIDLWRAERGEDAEKQEVQRPRAFYRRELQQQPFIIARPQK